MARNMKVALLGIFHFLRRAYGLAMAARPD